MSPGMRFRYLFSSTLVLIVLAMGWRNGSIHFQSDLQFPMRSGTNVQIPAHFVDRTELLGITGFKRARFRISPIPPANPIVFDFNNDGWEDILLLYDGPDGKSTLKLLKNVKGRYFRKMELSSEMMRSVRDIPVIGAGAADFDNDGWDDLVFISRTPNARARFYTNHKGQFRRQKTWSTELEGGDGRGVHFLDFDNDGFVDIYLTSYSAGKNEDSKLELSFLSTSGGKNFLLRNKGGHGFVEVGRESGADNTEHTWAAGISDFDGNGFPDIFLANEFGLDRLLMNRSGKFFDATKNLLGPRRAKFSASAETGDINNDGRTDIYASNQQKKGLLRGLNSFWENTPAGPGEIRFTDKAADYGIDQCGSNWGSKFVDIDRNGFLDIVAVNAPHRDRNLVANS
ncbi:MAG: VCBS repeat-containing protein, partial [Elusimicrobia bacterium]|nr:VCBS repeat-containing protein [Elusimicrobiota bacterium]